MDDTSSIPLTGCPSSEQASSVSPAIARMREKAAQLAEELQLAQNSASNGQSAALDLGAATNASTAVLRRLSRASVAAGARPGGGELACDVHHALAVQFQQLEAELQQWKGKHADALKELDRREESYMRREDQLRAQLAASQAAGLVQQPAPAGSYAGGGAQELSLSGAVPTAQQQQQAQQPQTLQELQQQMVHGVDELLQLQRLQMRAEEAEQLRQFRSRLSEIESQMLADKQAAAAHQDNWAGKTGALHEELARTQEIAAKLDTMYKLAEEEAAQMRVQFKAQEDDRTHLIRQLLAAKRENGRLKQENTAMQEELDAIIQLAAESTEPAAAAAAAALGSRPGSPCNTDGEDASVSLAAAIAMAASRRASSSSTMAAGGPAASRPGTASCHASNRAQLVQPRSAAGVLPLQQQQQQQQQQHTAHTIVHLQRLLEAERRQCRQLRSSYMQELGRRNELTTLLLHSIQAAKQQQQRHAEAGLLAQQQHSGDAGAGSCSAARPESRQQARPVVSRPGMAAGSRCQLAAWQTDAAAAASGKAEEQLEPAAWDGVLADLLVRQEVLELLLNAALPDFTAAAEELAGRHASSPAPPGGVLQQHLQQLLCILHRQQQWQQQQQQQQQRCPLQQQAGACVSQPSASRSDECMSADSNQACSGKQQAEASVSSHSEQQQQHARLCKRQQSFSAAAGDESAGSMALPFFPARQARHQASQQRPQTAAPAAAAGSFLAGTPKRPATASPSRRSGPAAVSQEEARESSHDVSQQADRPCSGGSSWGMRGSGQAAAAGTPPSRLAASLSRQLEQGQLPPRAARQAGGRPASSARLKCGAAVSELCISRLTRQPAAAGDAGRDAM